MKNLNFRPMGMTAFAAIFSIGLTAQSAEIYVRTAKGYDISNKEANRITKSVEDSIRIMPEHHLVTNESQADFVLQPSVINRDGQLSLRLEKEIGGDTLAMAEESMASVQSSAQPARSVTELALQEDMIADSDLPAAVINNESMTKNIAGQEGIPTSPNPQPRSLAQADRDTVSGTSVSPMDAQDWSEAGAPPSRDERLSRDFDTVSGMTSDSTSGANNYAPDVRAPSPRITDPNRINYFQVGAGPAYGFGLDTQNVMINVNASYNRAINTKFSAKAFGDLNFAGSNDASRFITLGVGGEYFPSISSLGGGLPYVTADIGFGSTRDSVRRTEDGAAVGAGAGFKFAASQINFDVNLHYTVLTEQLNGENPSILGLRAAMNF